MLPLSSTSTPRYPLSWTRRCHQATKMRFLRRLPRKFSDLGRNTGFIFFVSASLALHSPTSCRVLLSITPIVTQALYVPNDKDRRVSLCWMIFVEGREEGQRLDTYVEKNGADLCVWILSCLRAFFFDILPPVPSPWTNCEKCFGTRLLEHHTYVVISNYRPEPSLFSSSRMHMNNRDLHLFRSRQPASHSYIKRHALLAPYVVQLAFWYPHPRRFSISVASWTTGSCEIHYKYRVRFTKRDSEAPISRSLSPIFVCEQYFSLLPLYTRSLGEKNMVVSRFDVPVYRATFAIENVSVTHACKVVPHRIGSFRRGVGAS